MKAFINRLSPSLNYDRGVQWGKLIAITGGAQVLVQVAGFVSGILIIRLLSTQEYAFYTLANTMLGTMVMLADNGISNGVMAEAGKVWQDKVKIGSVLSTGLYLRKRFAAYTLLVTLPVSGYLLVTHNAGWLTVALINLALIPSFYASLSDTLLEIPLKLHQDITPLQKNQVEVSIIRLILNAISLVVFPFTFVALITNGLSRIYGNYKLKKISSKFADIDEVLNEDTKKEILWAVRRTLPIVVYHCISGQLSIWLTSLFGTTASIAQLGALGRLSVVFTLVATLFTTLVVPRFARMSAARGTVLKHFVSIQLVAVIVSLTLLLAIWAFTNQILWILGPNYTNLQHELLLVNITNGIILASGVCSQLILSRGWFMNPYFLIGVNFISTLVSISFFNVSSLIGILYFNAVASGIAYIINIIYGVVSINKLSDTNSLHSSN